MDKIEYTYLTTVHNATFRIIGGVEITLGSNSMAKQTQILLNLRDKFPEHGDSYKKILQMFHGVLCERMKPRKLYSDNEEAVKKKIQKYDGLVLQTRKLPNQQRYVTKVQLSQNDRTSNAILGIEIRSRTRIGVCEIIDHCIEKKVEVFRVHTDSLLIRASDVEKLSEFIAENTVGMLRIKKTYPNGVKILNVNNVVPA